MHNFAKSFAAKTEISGSMWKTTRTALILVWELYLCLFCKVNKKWSIQWDICIVVQLQLLVILDHEQFDILILIWAYTYQKWHCCTGTDDNIRVESNQNQSQFKPVYTVFDLETQHWFNYSAWSQHIPATIFSSLTFVWYRWYFRHGLVIQVL